MATINVKDAAGATVAIEKPLVPGRAPAATSRPVAFSNEDFAVLDGIEASLIAIDGRVDTLEALIASTNTKIDASNVSLAIIDNLITPAALGAGGGLKVQMYTAAGVAVDPVPSGANTIANSVPTDYANDSVMAGRLAGLTPYKSLDLDESEEEVKATAGVVFSMIATNRRTTPLFVKFYNATAATVVVGTTVPVMTIEIPANATDHTMAVVGFTQWGVAFGTAICIAATTSFEDTNAGAPALNDLIVTVLYK